MKKVLFILFLFPILWGCSANQEEQVLEAQSFSVSVYTQYSNAHDEKPATVANPESEKCYVYLFQDVGKEVDKKASFQSVYRTGKIVYADGSSSSYKYRSDTEGSIHALDNIPNGRYILFVAYVAYGYPAGCSHKYIDVNKDSKSEKKVFLYKNREYGYQAWDEYW